MECNRDEATRAKTIAEKKFADKDYTGADGAFKIVSEAWNLLSDKTKRLAYNQRRNSSQASGINGVHIYVNRTTTRRTTRPKNQNYRGFVSTSKLDSFWTICHGCKMHYEYLKVFVNHTLICPNCLEPFHAVEMATPMNIPKPGYQYAYQWNRNSGDHGMCNSGRRMGASGIHWGSSSGMKVPDDMLRREGGVFYCQPPLKRRKVEGRFRVRKRSYLIVINLILEMIISWVQK
ncbi:unnamed protein product [Lactuca saligna]|uniref:Zinc beta-ribbon domain-containing protein n=1 Tax=Lactuca saligna TaxID=75948 RepID=A0AA36A296_LACSI|nr:unnamed protein product [Lactuca saligna]